MICLDVIDQERDDQYLQMAQAVSLGAWGDKKAWKTIETELKTVKKVREMRWDNRSTNEVTGSSRKNGGVDGGGGGGGGGKQGERRKTVKAPPHVIRREGFGYSEVRVKIKHGKMGEIPGRVEPLGGPPDKG